MDEDLFLANELFHAFVLCECIGRAEHSELEFALDLTGVSDHGEEIASKEACKLLAIDDIRSAFCDKSVVYHAVYVGVEPVGSQIVKIAVLEYQVGCASFFCGGRLLVLRS